MKKKLYIFEDVSDSGRDYLKQSLGTIWRRESGSVVDLPLPPSDGTRGVAEYYYYANSTNLNISDTYDDLRDITVASAQQFNLDAKYEIFGKIEINPSRITKIDDKTLIPNFKIPVRIYSNIERPSSDKFWKRVFMGGVHNTEIYPRLIDQSTIFYDLAFNLQTHDTFEEYRIITNRGHTTPGGDGSAKLYSKYNHYNNFVDNYMEWTKDKHELLLPNYNFEVNWRADAISTIGADLDVRDLTTPEGVQGMWKLRKVRATDKPYLNLLDYHYPAELGADWGWKNACGTHTEGRKLKDTWLGNKWIYNWTPTEELKNNIIRHQKNIMFGHGYFAAQSNYDDIIDQAPSNYENSNIYNITINFKKHSPSGEGQEQQRNYEQLGEMTWEEKLGMWYFRKSIEKHNIDTKFLEALKDLDSGAIEGFKMDKMNFKVQTDEMTLDSEPGRSVYSNTKTDSIKIDSFNYMDFLLYLHNEHGEAINDDYIFMGPPATANASRTYKNNLLYRYANNSDLLGTIDDSIRQLQIYFQDLYRHDDVDPATGTGYAKVQDSVYHNMLNAHTKFAEVLAYKIEKHGGDKTGDSQTDNHIQNFWVFNSSSGSAEDITIRDTQVKYGKEYTYKAYAYVAVISHKYKYTNFRLTKRTSQYGPTDVRNNTDAILYCVQFYDPISNQVAPQIFSIANSPEKLPGEEEYSNLAEYNTFATSEHDITHSPHLADFYLNVEPCVKILKIPIFQKKLGVFESPDAKIVPSPFYVIDDSKKIGFHAQKEGFSKNTYPSTITDADLELKEKYLNSQCLFEEEYMETPSSSPARFIEVYRIDKSPTSYRDFKHGLVSKIDLRIPDTTYNRSDYTIFDKIIPNKKYYYLMRTVTELGTPGQCSSIFEAELIDDGGYKFATFDIIDTSKFVESDYKNKTTSFKKLFQLEPNINQLFLDTTYADFSRDASSQINSVGVGRPSREYLPSMWDKKFKIRLTSRKTGKKTDINVTFNIQEKDLSS